MIEPHFMFSRLSYNQNPIIELPEVSRGKELFLQKIVNGEYTEREQSYICGSDDGLCIATQDRYGIPCNTFICKNCGTGYESPILDDKSLDKFYQTDYRTMFGDRKSVAETFAGQERLGGKIINFVKNLKQSGTVFDVGCGTGGTLLPFINDGFNCYGCDFETDYIQYGRDKGVRIAQGGVSALKPHGKADVIIMHHVVEHFAHPVEQMNEIVGYLKDDGILFMGFPPICKLQDCWAGDLLAYLSYPHFFYYTIYTLSKMLLQCGLILNIQSNDWGIFSKNPKSKDLDVPSQFDVVFSYLCSLVA